jgi:hypothetical protein
MPKQGYAVAYLVEALCYKLEGDWFYSDEVSGFFFFFQFTSSFQPHYGSGVDSALTEMITRNLPGGQRGRRVWLTTSPL